jgi:hypothetical protein
LVPAIGFETFTASNAHESGSGRLNGIQLLSCVDRVSFNTEGGVARTTLVKYLHPKS